MSITEVERIISESKDKEEALGKLRSLKPRRQKAPPPPEGGIGVREAARKYGVSRMTVSRLARSGKVTIITRTRNWLFIDEASLRVALGVR